MSPISPPPVQTNAAHGGSSGSGQATAARRRRRVMPQLASDALQGQLAFQGLDLPHVYDNEAIIVGVTKIKSDLRRQMSNGLHVNSAVPRCRPALSGAACGPQANEGFAMPGMGGPVALPSGSAVPVGGGGVPYPVPPPSVAPVPTAEEMRRLQKPVDTGDQSKKGLSGEKRAREDPEQQRRMEPDVEVRALKKEVASNAADVRALKKQAASTAAKLQALQKLLASNAAEQERLGEEVADQGVHLDAQDIKIKRLHGETKQLREEFDQFYEEQYYQEEQLQEEEEGGGTDEAETAAEESEEEGTMTMPDQGEVESEESSDYDGDDD